MIEDYALDLQARLLREPYASLPVRKKTLTAAISSRNGFIDMSSALKGVYKSCLGTWFTDWGKAELTGHLDTHCRIVRQRAAAGAPGVIARRARMPLPPAKLAPGTDARGHFVAGFSPDLVRGYRVPAMRTDSLWRKQLGGAHIDFLKCVAAHTLSARRRSARRGIPTQ